MRYVVAFVCVFAVGVMPLVGCSDPEGTGGTGGSGGMGGSGGNGGAGGMGGDGGAGGQCPEENYPPSIVSQPDSEYPLNQIGKLDLDDPLPPEPAEVLLEVIVRDPNVEQTLQYRVFLDSLPPPASEFSFDEGYIEPSGFLERPRTFAIPYDELDPGECHKIELVVVGRFASNVEKRRPVDPGDIDQATWWVRVINSDFPIAQECR